MESVEFEIPGKPIAWSRPRLTGQGRFYDSQSAKKADLKKYLYIDLGFKGLYKAVDQRLSIEMTFYTPIGKSFSKVKQTRLEGTYDFKKPDVDNYLKFYLDAFTGVFYDDDQWVCEVSGRKLKSLRPRVEVKICCL